MIEDGEVMSNGRIYEIDVGDRGVICNRERKAKYYN